MAALSGFPTVSRTADLSPGDVFMGSLGSAPVFVMKSNSYVVLLLGHGGPPRQYAGVSGPYALLPGEVQFRPLRDRSWSMSWVDCDRPGDIILSADGPFMHVVSHQASPTMPHHTLINLKTGLSGHGTGPIFRGWELVCFPAPGRPMVLGAYEPDGKLP